MTGDTSNRRQPTAKQVPHVWERPTGPDPDPYAWLADRDDPDTLEFLRAENEAADAWLAERGDLVEAVFAEIRSRVQEDDTSVPVHSGGWWYTTSTVTGRAYPVHSRGRTPTSATDTILLDENAEADGVPYFALGTFDVSPDHLRLAWSADVDGGEHFTLRIRDLASGTDLADEIPDTTWAGTAWSADSTHLFYVTADDQERPFRVWCHRVGTAVSDDRLVFEEADERFYVGVGLTRSERWVVISSESKTSSEVLLVPAAEPLTEPRIVRSRRPEVEYQVDDWGDRLVILTNLDALDFRVMTAPADRPSEWQELIAHVPGRRITRVEPFAGHLVVHEWVDAGPRLRVLGRDGSERILDLGDEPHDVELEANPEWDATTLRYTYESLTTPSTLYEEDLLGGGHTLLKRTPTPNVDLSRYTSRREWATAPDGTAIPLDIVHRVDVAADAPGLVYGYGAYEASLAPWFSVARLSLLDRGWVWALVHPRGGGELGRRWYEEGRLLNKRNTFDDTNSCGDHLLSTGTVGRLALRGGSAGGLLVGACLNRRPDLWAAAVAEVPFVDVVTTMSDPEAPLTVTEWEEWGDPRAEPFASEIRSWSPYDNTTARDYPALYVTAGLTDPRVSYHEPAKWVARIREVRTNDAPLLLRTEMGAGHGGPSGRYERWRDEARVIAFLLTVLAP